MDEEKYTHAEKLQKGDFVVLPLRRQAQRVYLRRCVHRFQLRISSAVSNSIPAAVNFPAADS